MLADVALQGEDADRGCHEARVYPRRMTPPGPTARPPRPRSTHGPAGLGVADTDCAVYLAVHEPTEDSTLADDVRVEAPDGRVTQASSAAELSVRTASRSSGSR